MLAISITFSYNLVAQFLSFVGFKRIKLHAANFLPSGAKKEESAGFGKLGDVMLY